MSKWKNSATIKNGERPCTAEGSLNHAFYGLLEPVVGGGVKQRCQFIFPDGSRCTAELYIPPAQGGVKKS